MGNQQSIDSLHHTGAGRGRPSKSKVRILIADDRLLVRSSLRSLIQSRDDFEVCAEASDGRQAIEQAMLRRPDVVILDMMLPVVDGIEATRQIRKKAPPAEVMIFSVQQREEVIREAVLAGARGYLFKWESDERIVAAIETLARHGEFYSSHAAAVLSAGVDNRNGSCTAAALTLREREIVRLIAEGERNKKIANLLGISTKTVEAHRAASMRKLGAHSTAELVRYAIRFGLIEP